MVCERKQLVLVYILRIKKYEFVADGFDYLLVLGWQCICFLHSKMNLVSNRLIRE